MIEPKSEYILCGFRPSHSITERILNLQKIMRNLGSLPNMYMHVLPTSKKHTTGFLGKIFRPPVTGRQVIIPTQTFASMPAELNQNRPTCVFDFNKDVCCHHSSS